MTAVVGPGNPQMQARNLCLREKGQESVDEAPAEDWGQGAQQKRVGKGGGIDKDKVQNLINKGKDKNNGFLKV